MKHQHQTLASPGMWGASPAPRCLSVPGAGLSGDNMQLGYIKLFRKQLDWTWYKDSYTKSLFNHLLLIANYKDSEWMGMQIKRGQCVTGLNSLSETTGISKQSIRTSLKRLISTHDITVESTHRFSVVTICNYDAYQSSHDESNTVINTASNTPTTHRQHTANNIQEGKEGKNGKKTEKEDLVVLPVDDVVTVASQVTVTGRDLNMTERDKSPVRASVFNEDSHLKKITEAKGVAISFLSLGSQIDTPEFWQSWSDWIQHRKERRRPLTSQTVKRQIQMLERMPVQTAIKCIETSLQKGWEGLFEPEPINGKSAQKPTAQPSEGQAKYLAKAELDRVEERLKQIDANASYTSQGVIYSAAEKKEMNALKSRRAELEKILGFKA